MQIIRENIIRGDAHVIIVDVRTPLLVRILRRGTTVLVGIGSADRAGRSPRFRRPATRSCCWGLGMEFRPPFIEKYLQRWRVSLKFVLPL